MFCQGSSTRPESGHRTGVRPGCETTEQAPEARNTTHLAHPEVLGGVVEARHRVILQLLHRQKLELRMTPAPMSTYRHQHIQAPAPGGCPAGHPHHVSGITHYPLRNPTRHSHAAPFYFRRSFVTFLTSLTHGWTVRRRRGRRRGVVAGAPSSSSSSRRPSSSRLRHRHSNARACVCALACLCALFARPRPCQCHRAAARLLAVRGHGGWLYHAWAEAQCARLSRPLVHLRVSLKRHCCRGCAGAKGKGKNTRGKRTHQAEGARAEGSRKGAESPRSTRAATNPCGEEGKADRRAQRAPPDADRGQRKDPRGEGGGDPAQECPACRRG